MMRRHLLICRGSAGSYIRAAYDGKRWLVDVDRPQRLDTTLLNLRPALPQIASGSDFTISPFRTFADFDMPPDEFPLPDGKPVALACPTSKGPGAMWQWLQYYSPHEKPLISGLRFGEARCLIRSPRFSNSTIPPMTGRPTAKYGSGAISAKRTLWRNEKGPAQGQPFGIF